MRGGAEDRPRREGRRSRPTACMVIQYNEAPAGQSVFHLHVHVIPRFEGVPLKPHTGEMEDPQVLATNAEKVRRALG